MRTISCAADRASSRRYQRAHRATLPLLLGATSALAADAVQVQPVQLHIMQKGLESLITTSQDEWYRLMNVDGWHEFDGSVYAFDRPIVEGIPIYRYYKAANKDHLFTADRSEGDLAIKYLQYQYEGICCYLVTSPNQKIGGQRYVFSSIQRFLVNDKVHYYVPGGENDAPLTDHFGLKQPGTLKFEGRLGYYASSNFVATGVPARAKAF